MPANVVRVYFRSRTLRLVDFFLLKKLLANLPILCPGENIIFTNLFKVRLSTRPSSLLTSDMSLDITKTTFSFDNSLYEFTEPTQSYYTRGYGLLQWIWFVLSQWSYGQSCFPRSSVWRYGQRVAKTGRHTKLWYPEFLLGLCCLSIIDCTHGTSLFPAPPEGKFILCDPVFLSQITSGVATSHQNSYC